MNRSRPISRVARPAGLPPGKLWLLRAPANTGSELYWDHSDQPQFLGKSPELIAMVHPMRCLRKEQDR